MNEEYEDKAQRAHRQAIRLYEKGQYAEALKLREWFHENALKISPSLYGVRLSYALYAWLDLGRAYPPAMESFLAVRERDKQALLDGTGTVEHFAVVSAINRTLEEDDATMELFRTLHEIQPSLAAECFRRVDGELLETEPDLFLQYRPDLEMFIRSELTMFLQQRTAILTFAPDDEDRAETLEHFEKNFRETCTLTQALALQIGKIEVAEAIAKLARGEGWEEEQAKIDANWEADEP